MSRIILLLTLLFTSPLTSQEPEVRFILDRIDGWKKMGNNIVVPETANPQVRAVGYLKLKPGTAVKAETKDRRPVEVDKISDTEWLILGNGTIYVDTITIQDNIPEWNRYVLEIKREEQEQEQEEDHQEPEEETLSKDSYLVLIEESSNRTPEVATLINSTFWLNELPNKGYNRPLIFDKDSDSGRLFIEEAKKFNNYHQVPFMAIMDNNQRFERSFKLKSIKELREIVK